MTIGRVFLDWHRPALAAAVDYLAERFASADQFDLERVVVALPGARAGRRLLEILVTEADRRQLQLCPPRIVTAGKLPELLYEAQRPFANDLVQQLAWIEALRRTEPRQVELLVPAAPARDDLPAWLSLGDMLGRLHRELAADALDFPAVAECGARMDGFREVRRWEALAEVQRQYLAVLDRQELWDLQTARLVAIREAECHSDDQIVLVGAADLNRSQRMMLDQVAEQVTALVFAPAELADRFDEHGCVRAAAWLAEEIPIATEQIEVVDDPADQAEAVVRAMARLDGRFHAEQISLGVPDEQLAPYIEQRLESCGVTARYVGGRPMTRSAPYRLLAAVADFVESPRFPAFAALVRHPWIHQWLAGKRIDGDWLSRMDRYQVDHLPYRLDDAWPGKGDSPIFGPQGGERKLGQSPGERKLGQSLDASESPRQVYRAIDTLLEPLHAAPRPLAEWAAPISDLLVATFGAVALDPETEPDRSVLAACNAIRDALAEQAAVPVELAPSPDSVEAIRLVLRQIASTPIPPMPGHGAVELLGWLELPLDDAPTLIVTGMNEGRVPGSLNSDLFLPNQLRRALGIEDNDRRYARDAYALSVLAASRDPLHLVAGRRSPDADPMLPSRLLFACDETTLARRVRAFFSDKSSGAAPGRGREFEGPLDASQLEIPRPEPPATPCTSMRVTEFRDYLACPYRYYLRHVLKLEGLSDAAVELDGGAFGSLAHEVLGRFGKSDLAGSTDAETIRDGLGQLLDAAVAKQYGPTPLASIRVQVEQLRRRFDGFAPWQADWAAKGWRIEHVEVSPPEGSAKIDVDGQPMGLRGRIDRIDVNETSGRRMVFDYKTSDQAKTPDQAHRAKSEWIDLQLPLYRGLVAGLGIEGPVDLAYIVLPKDISKVGELRAEWTAEDFDDADRAAADVVRRVRAGQFWPPTSPPPPFAEEFRRICQDDRFGGAIGDEPEGAATS